MTAATSLRLALVNPHVVDDGCFFLADASNDSFVEARWNQIWLILCADTAFHGFLIKGVEVSTSNRDKFHLFLSGGVLKVVGDSRPTETSGTERRQIRAHEASCH